MHAKLSSNFASIELRDFQKSAPLSAKFEAMKRKSGNGNSSSDGASLSKKRKITFFAGANVPRPQVVYNMKVDNSYSTPFVPRLTRKPNASVTSLQESIKPMAHQNVITNSGYPAGPSHFYPHPYQHEIENFEVPLDFLEKDESNLHSPPTIDNLPAPEIIETRVQLEALIEVLRTKREIAVDLEHHSFRSYQGITSLMQISTDEHDYIVDVFRLWNDAEALNEIFTSPSILKVFHGAEYDVIWLQRDLGLYLVNLFDTAIAAKLLNYPKLSLMNLVAKFCDVQLDKRFQLADWRIRPLPEEMVNYARLDTRFLLYIYRCLKRELLEQSDESANLLRVVMDKSRDLCLKVSFTEFITNYNLYFLYSYTYRDMKKNYSNRVIILRWCGSLISNSTPANWKH